jgi:hypothetical protein
MENRYLPILHNNIPLCGLRASSETSFEDERAVKTVLEKDNIHNSNTPILQYSKSYYSNSL